MPAKKAAKAAESKPAAERPTGPKLCATVGCDRKAMWRGLCGAHYASRRGDGS